MCPYLGLTEKEQNSIMYTPGKEIKGVPECIRKRDTAANNLFSRAVSKIRQPIESLFNWLIQKQIFKEPLKSVQRKDLLFTFLAGLLLLLLVLFFDY